MPLLINILRHGTDDEPLSALLASSEAMVDTSSGALHSLDLALGYPYADVPQVGASVVAVAADAQTANEAANAFAEDVWLRRDEMRGEAISVDDALIEANVLASGEGPVVLLDVGDNVGAGSPGDSVVLLRAAQQAGIRGVLQSVCDRDSVKRCVIAGLGGQLELEIGGNTSGTGPPLLARCRVRALSDGRFRETRPAHGGFSYFNAGPTALVETSDGHTLVLCSRAVIGSTLSQFESVGVRPERASIIVAKGVFSPRPVLAPIARAFIAVDTPGITSARLESLPYRRASKSLFPLDPQVGWRQECCSRAGDHNGGGTTIQPMWENGPSDAT